MFQQVYAVWRSSENYIWVCTDYIMMVREKDGTWVAGLVHPAYIDNWVDINEPDERYGLIKEAIAAFESLPDDKKRARKIFK